MSEQRLGRDVLFDYLRDLGVHYLFGVPGTNEIPLIDGTQEPANEVAYVPCLHENIAVGAAMGYARASGKPGVVELHVTPGAAHGIGNLFNAYKSHIPLVVICVQQHNALVFQEPLLASDLVQVARQYTKWAYEVRVAEELPAVFQRAFKEALAPPTRPVFLSVPWEFTLAPVADAPPRVTRVGPRFLGDQEAVAEAARHLAESHNAVIVVGDGVGQSGAWPELCRLQALLGAPVYSEYLSSYMNFPNHEHHWQGELMPTQGGVQAAFKGHDVAFLCGYNAQAQVLVFRYELGPMIPRDVKQIYLHNDQWEIGKNDYGEVAVLGDIKTTLPGLCDEIERRRGRNTALTASLNAQLDELGARRERELSKRSVERQARTDDAALTGEDVAIALAAVQDELPAPLVLANEAVSDAKWFQAYPHYDGPADYFCAQGGSLGYSMPASIGLKLGHGQARAVVNVVGDGSALFYPHTWWTARKLNLPVLYVVTNNREYKTLLIGLEQVESIFGWHPSGDPWYLRLQEPPTSFVELAAAFGIAGATATNVRELGDCLHQGIKSISAGDPFVVEVRTNPSIDAGPAPRLDALVASKENLNDRNELRFASFGPP